MCAGDRLTVWCEHDGLCQMRKVDVYVSAWILCTGVERAVEFLEIKDLPWT